jgi:hypothetical protein
MHPQLSFEQAPPIDVPFRFFLTAPLFGVAAGLLLLVEGGDMLVSRWSSATLAGVHLLVAGYLLFAMCGALMQFVPVAAGGNVWRPRWVAAWVHPLLIVAVVLLVGAFLVRMPALFIGAAYGFSLALGVFCLTVGWALLRTPARGPTIVALRVALLGLLTTLTLGVILAMGLAGRISAPLPLMLLTDVHAAWGLGGWALTLLAGVSYLVVPMFQLTPSYPAWLARGLPLALLGVLLAWSMQYDDTSDSLVSRVILLGGLGIGAVFAAVTLRLQQCRRRKVSDLTLLFFRTAMLALLAVFISFLTLIWLPEQRLDPRAALWLGLLTLVGVFVSAINGMLYKIVPFLNWLHLQNLYGLKAAPPTMHQMIPEPAMRWQFRLHLAALAVLLAAIWLPVLARPAGLLFALSCAWLGWNLLGAVRVYRHFRNRIRAAAGELRS